MIITIAFILSPLFMSQGYCKENDLVQSEQYTERDSFPFSWEGKWEGDLNIFNYEGQVSQVIMELHIVPSDTSDTWSWTIIYGDAETGARPYELLTVDHEKGIYLIDEHNSIQLESYLVDGTLYSWFEVNNSLIQAIYRKNGSTINFEIVAGSSIPASTTGGLKDGDETIPYVKTYPVQSVQKAILYKVNE